MSNEDNRESFTELYGDFGISRKVLDFAAPILAGLKDRFDRIDDTAEYNQLRVIRAMQEAHIGEANLKGTTGYGYDDIGRDGLEKVYASYFHTEDALVRPQITCGTHALALALMSNLRPGDTLLSAAGKPYDTLEEVIGIRPSRGSLATAALTWRVLPPPWRIPPSAWSPSSGPRATRPGRPCPSRKSAGPLPPSRRSGRI